MEILALEETVWVIWKVLVANNDNDTISSPHLTKLNLEWKCHLDAGRRLEPSIMLVTYCFDQLSCPWRRTRPNFWYYSRNHM